MAQFLHAMFQKWFSHVQSTWRHLIHDRPCSLALHVACAANTLGRCQHLFSLSSILKLNPLVFYCTRILHVTSRPPTCPPLWHSGSLRLSKKGAPKCTFEEKLTFMYNIGLHCQRVLVQFHLCGCSFVLLNVGSL